MAKKLMRLGIKRDNNYMYYIKDGAVWAVPRKRPGVPKGKKRKVSQFAKKGELDYSKNLYFVDGDGDIAVSARGGKKKSKKK